MEEKLRAAIVEELQRQADASGRLKVRDEGDLVRVEGDVDVDALVMVVAGAVAGGP